MAREPVGGILKPYHKNTSTGPRTGRVPHAAMDSITASALVNHCKLRQHRTTLEIALISFAAYSFNCPWC